MNSRTPGHGHGSRRSGSRAARTAGVIAVIGAALLAAACGGSPSSTGSGGSPNSGGSANAQAVAYSGCVRAHGVPDFPDPDSSGQVPKDAAVRALREVSDSRAMAATAACADLNPAGQATNPLLTAQEQQDYLRAAACMRSHGFPGFPDPTFPGGHVNLPRIPSSIDTKSRQFNQAARTCIKLIPTGLPGTRPGG